MSEREKRQEIYAAIERMFEELPLGDSLLSVMIGIIKEVHEYDKRNVEANDDDDDVTLKAIDMLYDGYEKDMEKQRAKQYRRKSSLIDFDETIKKEIRPLADFRKVH